MSEKKPGGEGTSMLNRRGFFARIAGNVLFAAATIYCPRVLLDTEPRLTLWDWSQRSTGRFGRRDAVIRNLVQMNELLKEIVWAEHTTRPGFVTRINTPLPNVEWRTL